MAILQLQTIADAPSWRTQVPLDGVFYTLRCAWNKRDGYWYAGLWDEEDAVPLRTGVRLVPHFPLFTRVLPGCLYVAAPEGLRGEVADMGRLQLFYVDAASVAELVAGA